jgi:PTH1 family peptidyl-tRNA hydrolase
MTKLIVGLGNPGSEYRDTRHNIGFMVLDLMGEKLGLNWKSKFKGEFDSKTIDGEQIVFLKPQTYMNLSGESVQACQTFFKVKLEDILVLHDELDLPYGQVVLKKGGGLAGHNGLKSLAKHLSSKDYKRLRLGIGRPKHGDVSHFVLSRFSDDEQIDLERYLELGVDAVSSFIDIGFEKTSNKFSRKSITS